MPVRYSYHPLQPPAPFVHVTLRHPTAGAEQRIVPAQVDTGADRTVVPESVALALGLPRVGQLVIGGFGGAAYLLPTYAARVVVHDLPALEVEVIGSATESWVLLGRDVLNAHRILLDGPALALEIG